MCQCHASRRHAILSTSGMENIPAGRCAAPSHRTVNDPKLASCEPSAASIFD